jgi:hypothetical protein
MGWKHVRGCTALSSESPAEVAKALRRLAGDPALRVKMVNNGARAFALNAPKNFARPIVTAIRNSLLM